MLLRSRKKNLDWRNTVSGSEAVVDDDAAEVTRLGVAVEAVVEQQTDDSDSPVERCQVRRVQHTGYDVVGQRLAHSRRQRLAASGSGWSRVLGDEKLDDFDERRSADEAALEDRSE